MNNEDFLREGKSKGSGGFHRSGNPVAPDVGPKIECSMRECTVGSHQVPSATKNGKVCVEGRGVETNDRVVGAKSVDDRIQAVLAHQKNALPGTAFNDGSVIPKRRLDVARVWVGTEHISGSHVDHQGGVVPHQAFHLVVCPIPQKNLRL